ncbi:MAG: hypothetical protein U5P10_17720 [Spirochaetia bacterium]|nr:hypothetical protein [Spirochaetia bacterium]
MENTRMRNDQATKQSTTHAGSAPGQNQGSQSPYAYAKMPQFAGTMGSPRPASPSSAGRAIRSYYTGSLC